MTIHDFHLLRPWYLLALLPAIILFGLHLKQQLHSSRWSDAIDAELLDALLDQGADTQRRWPLWCLLAGWTLATLALSGPCFEKSNQSALKQADAVVVLLDLSPSMLVQDVAPTRLQAAHYKILDLLRQRKEGYTGLVAYSGTAHVVAPLSDDANTVAALVTTLEPGIMPVRGSQAEDAVAEALKLLENSHFARGRLLLISDGIAPAAVESIHQQLRGKSVELHVIGVGTAKGGPLPLQNGSFLKDDNGKPELFPFSPNLLQQLAEQHGGHYSDLRSDDSDIAALAAPPSWLARMGNDNSRDASHTIEHWHDAGYWLALPCLLLVLLSFRRGLVMCLLPLFFLTASPDTRALDLPDFRWKDLWQTPDQQAAAALAQGDNKTAAEQFRNPEWKAFAEYQNQQHKEAAEHFAERDSATAHYNRGNALAHTMDLQGALDAYDEALKRDPSLAYARENRALVKKLLEEQKKQQQNQQDKNQKNQDQQKQDEQQKQDQDQQKQDQQQDGEKKQDPQQNDSQQDSKQQDSQQQDSQQQNQSPQQSAQEKPSAGEQKDDQQKNQPQNAGQQDQQQKDQQQKEQQPEDPQAKEQQAEAKRQSDAKEKQEPANETQGDKGKDPNSTSDSKDRDNREKQRAAEQWLRRVPDDPGGLLRNKFDYYYQLQLQQQMRARRAGPEPATREERW